MSALALAALPGAIPAASALPSFSISTLQVGSQIQLEMDSTWATPGTGGATQISPPITNYEYTTDGGTTWVQFDPPLSTPQYNSVAGNTPFVGICTTSDTGQPFATGQTYDVALRALNSAGPAAETSPSSLSFSAYDFYEMNGCGGGWGGQDLKVITGGDSGSDSWFNMFQVYRGGLLQVYSANDKNTPSEYCFYLFAQARVIGCDDRSSGFNLASGVAQQDWGTPTTPEITSGDDTWRIIQSSDVNLGGDDTYILTTTLDYRSPNSFVDVHHELQAPDVSRLDDTQVTSASSGSYTLSVTDGTNLKVGMCVSGGGIPAGAVIKSKSGNTITLDDSTTSAISGNVMFSACAKIYHSSDMYLDGSDDGPGDSSLVNGNRLVAQVSDPANVDPANGVFGGIGGIMEVTGYPFQSWVEGKYSCMFGGGSCSGAPWGVNYGGTWPDTVDSSPTQDAGTAAEWTVTANGSVRSGEVKTRIYFAPSTPSLSAYFSPRTATRNTPVNLVITLSNSPNWDWQSGQFDLALPAGAQAGTPVTTCPSPASATVVSGTLQFRNATLTDATLSCTVTVPLTFSTDGTYSITPTSVTNNTIVTTGTQQSATMPAFVAASTTISGGGPGPGPGPSPVYPPSAPQNVTAQPRDGAALVSWNPPASSGTFPVSTYRVYSEPGGKFCLVTAPATSCLVEGLTNGVPYTFRAEALNGAGWSPLSDPSAPVVPGPAPRNVTAVPGDTSATVSWQPPASGGPYTAYRVTAQPGGESCTVLAPATSCVVPGLTNGEPYAFTVEAEGPSGWGPAASTTSPVTPTGDNAPQYATAVPGDRAAAVSWDPPASGVPVQQYRVTAYPGGQSCTVDAPATTCVVPGLTNGTPYVFTVEAKTADGWGPHSAPSPAVTPLGGNTPSGVTAVAGDTSATVSWQAPSSGGPFTSYRVTAQPGGQTCTVRAPETTCVVPGLTNGVPYTFTVQARNADGWSAPSAPSTAVTPTGTNAPQAATAVPGNRQATVSWDPPASGVPVQQYRVTAYPGGQSCTVDAPATTCVVPGLTNGVPYVFTVEAKTADGWGPHSAPTLPVVPSGGSAPSGVQAVAGDRSATVSWQPPTGGAPVTEYRVTAYPGGQTCTVAAPATTCVVPGLTNGVPYTFTVQAKTADGWGPASVPSPSATPTGNGAPRNASAVPGDRQATVSWQAPANGVPVLKYRVTAYPGGQTCTVEAPATTCVVLGLTNGVPYMFTVQAKTASGWGPHSAPTPAVVPFGGSTPRSVTATPADRSAVVSWKPPKSNKPKVIGYKVTSSPGGKGCRVSAPATSCTVTGLTNGVSYRFRVKALTKKGASGYSTRTAPLTPTAANRWIVLNQGSRADDGLHDRIRTSGASKGIPAGTMLTPWIRFAGQESFVRGTANIEIQANGAFTWTRLINKDRRMVAYVSWRSVESNKVVWARVR